MGFFDSFNPVKLLSGGGGGSNASASANNQQVTNVTLNNDLLAEKLGEFQNVFSQGEEVDKKALTLEQIDLLRQLEQDSKMLDAQKKNEKIQIAMFMLSITGLILIATKEA